MEAFPSSSSRKSASTGPMQPPSLKKLKSDLKDALKQSGVLDTVKAQIRKEFISSLSNSGKIGAILQSVDDAGNTVKLGGVRHVDLKSRLALSAAYHLMRKRGMVHSLSVFAAESGLDSKASLLSESDIVSSLNVNGSSPLYKAILQASKAATEMPDKENNAPEKASVIELMFEHCFSMIQKGGRDSAVQTDLQSIGDSPREALDAAVRDLRTSYATRLDAERSVPVKGIEERLLAYQRDCDGRMARELDIQMSAFRESEVGRIRQEESQRARIELHSLRNELEGEYLRRSQAYNERETENARQSAERERKLQLAAYEARQKMQRELDDMRSREMAGGRKIEMEAQAMKLLELRLTDQQNSLESRERELAKRERDLERREVNAVEIARDGARQSLRQEIEAVSDERRIVAIDRKRLQEEKTAHSAELEGAATVRAINKDLQATVAKKEAELAEQTKKIQSLETLMLGEDTIEGRNKLLVYAKRNTELEAKLIMLEAADKELKRERAVRHSLEGEARGRDAEHSRLRADVETLTSKFEQERTSNETVRRELQAEKLRCAAATLRVQELDQLLGDKRRTIASLMRAGSGSLALSSGQGSTVGTKAAKQRAEDFATSLILSRQAREGSNAPSGAMGYNGSLLFGGPYPPPGVMMYPPGPHFAYPAQHYGTMPPPLPIDPGTREISAASNPTVAVGSSASSDADKLEVLRSDLEKQRLATEFEALAWEKAKIERQRALYQEEESLERARLEAEGIRLGAEKLELQRRKQTYAVQHELQVQQREGYDRQRGRVDDELLDRPLPAAEFQSMHLSVTSVSSQAVAVSSSPMHSNKSADAIAGAAPFESRRPFTVAESITPETPRSPAIPSAQSSPILGSSSPEYPSHSLASPGALSSISSTAAADRRHREEVIQLAAVMKEKQDREEEYELKLKQAEALAAAARAQAEAAALELQRRREEDEREQQRVREEEAEVAQRLSMKRAAEERAARERADARRREQDEARAAEEAARAQAAALAASKSREELDKIEADKTAIAEARAKVLARKNLKKGRDEPPVSVAAPVARSPVRPVASLEASTNDVRPIPPISQPSRPLTPLSPSPTLYLHTIVRRGDHWRRQERRRGAWRMVLVAALRALMRDWEVPADEKYIVERAPVERYYCPRCNDCNLRHCLHTIIAHSPIPGLDDTSRDL